MKIEFEEAVQVNENNYRYYRTPKGNKPPSITTILSKTKSEKSKQGIEVWQRREGDAAYHIVELAKIYGTKTHKAIEDTLNNCIPDVESEMVNYHYKNLFRYLKNINNIKGIELILYSDKLNLAGTADCVAEYNGILSIIDYKTKRKPQREEYMEDAFIQATAYSIMFEELTGINIPQIVVLVSVENGNTQEFVKDPKNYKNLLDYRLARYYELTRIK